MILSNRSKLQNEDAAKLLQKHHEIFQGENPAPHDPDYEGYP
jgi:hypothetical protein